MSFGNIQPRSPKSAPPVQVNPGQPKPVSRPAQPQQPAKPAQPQQQPKQTKSV